MTHRLNRVLLALLVLIGVPYYWLLIDNRTGDVRPAPVNIAQLRALARSVPGPRPTGINSELVAFGFVPGNLVVAGSGVKRKLLGVMAYRLERPGSGPAIVDTGMTRKQAAAMELASFNLPAQQRVDAQMRKASLILLTGVDDEHAGGFSDLSRRANILRRAVLGQVQAHALAPSPGSPPGAAGQAPRAVAPGIVVIPTDSPARGNQMVYVQMVDGAEYLFCGDVAPFAQSWKEQRGRSRLYSDWRWPEDRDDAFAWLGAIASLKKQAPRLRVIPGHDFEWIHDPRNATGIATHFPNGKPPAQATGQ